MQKLETIAGKTYVVSSPNGGTVTSADGLVKEDVEAGKQKVVFGTGAPLQLDDDAGKIMATFKLAPSIGAGGGATIAFDEVPTEGSGNAVISGGLYNMLSTDNLKLGYFAYIQGSFATAIGGRSEAKGTNSSAFGNGSSTTQLYATALGSKAAAKGINTTTVGANIRVSDDSVVCLGALAFDGYAPLAQTNLYIIAAGSPLANTYEDGEACLGYVTKQANGTVLACGTRKLSELLTNNTAFAPAMLDLDSDPPTPFLPSGATDPIELPELEEYV